MDKTQKTVQKLSEATEGLLFTSESDYPFDIIVWRGQALGAPLSPESLIQITEHTEDTPVELMDLDTFFKGATQEQDWHDESEKESVARFQELAEILHTDLDNVQVYKVGEFEMDVFILGTVASDVVGLSTKIVET